MGGKSTGAAEKAPDNNKRLAALEAGVSSLALAMASNGIEIPADGNVLDEAVVAVKDLASLRAQVAQLADHLLANHPAAIGEGGAIATAIGLLERGSAASAEEANDGEVKALKARIAELETENVELETDVTDAVSEKNRLANLLAEAGTSTAPPAVDQEAAPEPEPVERERPEAARDVGPEHGTLSSEEIALAVAAEAEFEVAFSNGEFEIVDFSSPAIVVSPGQLERVNSAQFAVGPAVLIRGAAAGEILHGAGLLLEGVQVGYCRFDPPIPIEPGQERKFDRALIFG